MIQGDVVRPASSMRTAIEPTTIAVSQMPGRTAETRARIALT